MIGSLRPVNREGHTSTRATLDYDDDDDDDDELTMIRDGGPVQRIF